MAALVIGADWLRDEDEAGREHAIISFLFVTVNVLIEVLAGVVDLIGKTASGVDRIADEFVVTVAFLLFSLIVAKCRVQLVLDLFDECVSILEVDAFTDDTLDI